MLSKTMVIILLFLSSCGSETKYEPAPTPTPTTPPRPSTPGAGTISFQQVRGILQQDCGSCHSNAAFLQSELALRNSSAKARITNRSMPPSWAEEMDEKERDLVLDFLDG
jgi:uncharacterized membrane protein